ncbi:MAG: EamA family transporter, partial [Enhydrobacter sp.]
YSFLAGMGVRTSGTVLGFQACQEVVNGAVVLAYGMTRRVEFVAYIRRHAAVGALAGLMSVIGFLAFLTAARSLPLGPTTALRETSVIFGAVIGTWVLKEGFGLRRITAAILVVTGIGLLAILH